MLAGTGRKIKADTLWPHNEKKRWNGKIIMMLSRSGLCSKLPDMRLVGDVALNL